MELIRTSVLTGISTFVRLISGFAVNKIVAVVAGPSGLALIGQVQNVASILQNTSSGLFGTAAVKYSAEWKNEPAMLQRFLSLSYTLVFWITLALGSITAAFSYVLAKLFLNNGSYWWVFALLGFSIPFFATNNLLLSVLNGLGEVRKLTILNVAQSVLGMVVSIGLPLHFGMEGALAATAIASSVVFVLLIREFRLHEWLRVRAVGLRTEIENLRRLRGYAIMAIASAVCAPCSQLLVREWIVEHCSIDQAGYWQALNRLSGAYLVFFTSTLGVYFLPKFSQLSGDALRVEVRRGYIILLPTLGVVFVAVWILRGWIVPLLFSTHFQYVESLLAYQLAGDFLKMGSWLLSFVMLGKAHTRLFVFSEIIFSSLYVILSFWLIGSSGEGGIRGALLAWIALYGLYWLFLAVALRRELFGVDSHNKQ